MGALPRSLGESSGTELANCNTISVNYELQQMTQVTGSPRQVVAKLTLRLSAEICGSEQELS